MAMVTMMMIMTIQKDRKWKIAKTTTGRTSDGKTMAKKGIHFISWTMCSD